MLKKKIREFSLQKRGDLNKVDKAHELSQEFSLQVHNNEENNT